MKNTALFYRGFCSTCVVVNEQVCMYYTICPLKDFTERGVDTSEVIVS